MKEHIETARRSLGRLANTDNWRDVSLEDDDEATYDAMAWSPSDLPMDPNTGEIDDPLFHEPWEHARQSLAALAKIEAEHERVERRDTAAEFLSGYFGTRCKDYEPECFVCAAWKFYDELRSASEQKEPAQPPAPTWQPMETAPRNGKIILTFAVVDTDTGNWNMRLSWWRELRNDEGSHWMKWTEWCQPTHWMPMPAPPAASRIPEGE